MCQIYLPWDLSKLSWKIVVQNADFVFACFLWQAPKIIYIYNLVAPLSKQTKNLQRFLILSIFINILWLKQFQVRVMVVFTLLETFKTSIMKLSLHKRWSLTVKDFFSKYDQICRKLRIWSHLLKKSLMENFIFCVVLCEKKHLMVNCFCKKLHQRCLTGF